MVARGGEVWYVYVPRPSARAFIMDVYVLVIGLVAQAAVFLFGVGVVFQSFRSDSRYHAERITAVETRLSKVEEVVITLARQEERLNAMDQRLLAQGQRIDSQATIIGGRLEAINNIVSGHTAQLNTIVIRKNNT